MTTTNVTPKVLINHCMNPMSWWYCPDGQCSSCHANSTALKYEPPPDYKALAKELAEVLVLSRDCNYHGGQCAVLGRINAVVKKAIEAKLLDTSMELSIDERPRSATNVAGCTTNVVGTH